MKAASNRTEINLPGRLSCWLYRRLFECAKNQRHPYGNEIGMLAAEAIFESLETLQAGDEPASYASRLEDSWLWAELYKVRNIRPGFAKGLWLGLAHAAIDTYLFFGKAPWTLRHHADHDEFKAGKRTRQKSTIPNLMALSVLIAIHRSFYRVPIMKKISLPILP